MWFNLACPGVIRAARRFCFCQCHVCGHNRKLVLAVALALLLAGLCVSLLNGCDRQVVEPAAAIGEVAQSQARDAQTVADVAAAMKTEAPIVQPKAPETAAKLIVWSPLLSQVAAGMRANVEKLHAVQCALNEAKADAGKAKADTEKVVQGLKDQLKAEKDGNAKRGTWLLYLFMAGGIASVGVAVFLFIQGVGKIALGVGAGGAACSALAFTFLRTGNWIPIGVSIILLAGVAYLVVRLIRKYQAGVLNVATGWDAVEANVQRIAGALPKDSPVADELGNLLARVKNTMAGRQAENGIQKLVAKARGKNAKAA